VSHSRVAQRAKHPSCGGSPREGAVASLLAEQRLAAGGAQRSPDTKACKRETLLLCAALLAFGFDVFVVGQAEEGLQRAWLDL
jgi:hypothetical protein